jgi:hypothetical protein
VAAISTLLPGLKPSVVDKTLRTLDARLAPAGAIGRNPDRRGGDGERPVEHLARHRVGDDLDGRHHLCCRA